MSSVEGEDDLEGEGVDAFMVELELATRITGDKWSLLIIGPLLRGPRRFSSLLRMVKGISASLLTQRLKALEASGVVVRRPMSSTVEVPVYDLTAWGREIGTAVHALERWIATRPEGIDPVTSSGRRCKSPLG